jgi:hypothetical protein
VFACLSKLFYAKWVVEVSNIFSTKKTRSAEKRYKPTPAANFGIIFEIG